MKLSTIFRKAAELVASGAPFKRELGFGTQPYARACFAIQWVQGLHIFGTSAAQIFYVREVLNGCAHTIFLYGKSSDAEAQRARVIALLFAAELAKDEEREAARDAKLAGY